MITSYDNFTKEDLITENLALKSSLNLLQTELAQLKRMIFGSKSERFTPAIEGQEQLLFDDIETIEAEIKQQDIAYTRTKVSLKEKKHQGRLPLPKHLPRVEHIVEPSENTQGLVCIGKEITEELLAQNPLDKQVIVKIILESWECIFESKICNLQIGKDVFDISLLFGIKKPVQNFFK